MLIRDLSRSVGAAFLLFILIFSIFSFDSRAEKDGVVTVCIDPGHGGENLGAEWSNLTEKELTLAVAKSMASELEQYEGIRVVMTREDDEELSLEERVEIAEKENADFLFCVHFNMSEEHDMYGAECWISAFGSNYAKGMDFAKLEMEQLKSLGLYDRGIKTRMNDRGTNYYGILRIGDLKEVPSVIIEHCHLDHSVDVPYYEAQNAYERFGILDATAVAQYFGLKKKDQSQDYTDFEYEHTDIPDKTMKPDYTEPTYVKADNLSAEYYSDEHAVVSLSLSSEDPDCNLLYYEYSYDGGNSWSARFPWVDGHAGDVYPNEPSSSNTINISVDVPYDTELKLVFKVYNLFNLEQFSDRLTIDPVAGPVEDEPLEISEETQYTEISRAKSNNTDKNVPTKSENFGFFLLIAVLCLCFTVVVIIMVYIMYGFLRR